MNDELEEMVIFVRADTTGFAREMAQSGNIVEKELGEGFDKIGDRLQNGLSRAIKRGSLDFKDLKRTALQIVDDIAAASLQSGLSNIFGASSGSGLLGIGLSFLTTGLGLPGRATGGPVTDSNPYLVGEHGPEVFIPNHSGRVVTLDGGSRAATTVNLTFNIAADRGRSSAQEIKRSSRFVTRQIREALDTGRV